MWYVSILCYFEVVAVNVSSLIITHRSQHTLLSTNDPRLIRPRPPRLSHPLQLGLVVLLMMHAQRHLIVTCTALLRDNGDGLYTITQLLNTRRCSAISWWGHAPISQPLGICRIAQAHTTQWKTFPKDYNVNVYNGAQGIFQISIFQSDYDIASGT